jgi:hypothetical protein
MRFTRLYVSHVTTYKCNYDFGSCNTQVRIIRHPAFLLNTLPVHVFVNIPVVLANQAAWCSSEVLDFYLVAALFISRSGHRLSYQGFVAFFSPSKQIPGLYFYYNKSAFFHILFVSSFINHLTIQH